MNKIHIMITEGNTSNIDLSVDISVFESNFFLNTQLFIEMQENVGEQNSPVYVLISDNENIFGNVVANYYMIYKKYWS